MIFMKILKALYIILRIREYCLQKKKKKKKKKKSKFKNTIYEYLYLCDGNSSKRILDEVVLLLNWFFIYVKVNLWTKLD